MSENKKWLKVGSIRKSKAGKSYIKIDSDVSLKAGDILNLQDPRTLNLSLAEKGIIKSEEAETRNAKIPEYIKYDLVKAPNNT